MKHLKKNRSFGLITGQRRAFLRILVHNLIMAERIQTTEARAKEIKPRVEKLVTLAKKGELSATRTLLSRVPKDAAYKLVHDLGPRYKERGGGYLRIRKTAKLRKRDGATQSVIEFV